MTYDIFSIINDIVQTAESAFFYTPAIYPDAKSFFFKGLKLKHEITDKLTLEDGIRKVEAFSEPSSGCFGTIKYEAAYCLDDFRHLNPSSALNKQTSQQLGCIYFYDEVTSLSSELLSFPDSNNDPSRCTIEDFALNASKAEYIQAVKQLKLYIAEGDTYQGNFTIKSTFRVSGDIAGLFIDLVFKQSAKYTAIINTGTQLIITLSPELFFKKTPGHVSCLPMKGTGKRGYTIENDHLFRNNLAESEKDQAENVMIVDLIRNDLSKIPGIERVDAGPLFETEKYESLIQLVSHINAKTNPQTPLWEVFNALFPCGSITGAPKIRTMEILRELEKEARGIYTGTIFMGNKDKFVFNIPIRTLVIDPFSRQAEMGIGSGIVWDSDPEKEYEECLLKSKFLTAPAEKFHLFESILIENQELFLLENHLERLRRAADHFLFVFDKTKIHQTISQVMNQQPAVGSFYLRIALFKWGKAELQFVKYAPPPSEPLISISEIQISSKNPFQYFKTSKRTLYQTELKKCQSEGYFEVIFLNEREELTEGSFTNIFLRKGDTWFTPPLHCGLLNGVYREFLLKQDPLHFQESILTRSDLETCDEIMLTNSVRKSIIVKFPSKPAIKMAKQHE
jgi:para-aminobenzoate synthetase/4-amino-4-deoxychorismate lyase